MCKAIASSVMKLREHYHKQHIIQPCNSKPTLACGEPCSWRGNEIHIMGRDGKG